LEPFVANDTVTHFKLGKGYGLGRTLADTTRLPEDLKALHEKLGSHRIATLRAWIADLTSLFPPHAGHSVNDSLSEWVAWAETQPESGPLDTKNKRLLRRQGERWRALLSGEKRGTDDLGFGEYVDAGVQAFSQTGKLARQLAKPVGAPAEQGNGVKQAQVRVSERLFRQSRQGRGHLRGCSASHPEEGDSNPRHAD
jgi:hypothetical protein